MSHNRRALALRQQGLVASIMDFETSERDSLGDLQLHTRNSHEHNLPVRVSIYQNNLKAIANRALNICYPVITKMVGDTAMGLLSQKLLQREPFTTGDWGEWGSQLAALIASTPLTEGYPFLIDVAHFEWIRHQSSRDKVAIIDADSLTLLEQSDLNSLYIKLSDSVRTFASDFPLDTLWQVHQDSEDQTGLVPKLRRELEKSGEQYYFVVSSAQIQAQHQRISREEYLWLTSLAEGLSLYELLTQFPVFDFPGWLKRSIENRHFSHFYTTRNSD